MRRENREQTRGLQGGGISGIKMECAGCLCRPRKEKCQLMAVTEGLQNAPHG